jgi:hypothetical protein
MSKTVYSLTENDDGTWRCVSSDLEGIRGAAFGKTPDEAIAVAKKTLKSMNEFFAHNYGDCQQNCTHCLKGEKKGEWNGLT